MSAQTRPVRGSVRVLACSACDAEFPFFEYEVESDADAIGLHSAGICNGDLILLELSFEEWQAAQSGYLREIPSRLFEGATKEFYQFTHVLRVETSPLPPAGSSFADFRQEYKAPTVVYSCACCNAGEATTRREITPEEYVKNGGEITVLPPLTLVT